MLSTRIPFQLLQVQGLLQYKLTKSWSWLREGPWPKTMQSDPTLSFYSMGQMSVPGYHNSEAVTGCLNVCLGPVTHMPSGMKALLLCNVKVGNNSSKPHFSAGWGFFASIFSEVSSKSIVHVVDVTRVLLNSLSWENTKLCFGSDFSFLSEETMKCSCLFLTHKIVSSDV